jgi:hypothetical protein
MFFFKYFVTMILTCLSLSACKTGQIVAEQTPHPRLSTSVATAKMSPIGTAIRVTEQAALAHATAQALASITPATTPTLDPRVYVGVPQPNTLYWGQVGKKPALFVHKSSSVDDPNRGLLLYLDNSSGSFEDPFDFQELSRPYAVYTSELRVDLAAAQRDSEGKYVYVSLILDQTPPCQPGGINDQLTPCPSMQEINQLIEIDLTTLTPREIWAHDLFGDTYPDFEGNVVIDQVVNPLEVGGDRYIILRLLPCYACEPFPPHAMLVLNVNTGKEVYLGKVGNIHIDLSEQAVTYQDLGVQRVKCDPGPGCGDDGTAPLYLPAGDLLKQPLL